MGRTKVVGSAGRFGASVLHTGVLAAEYLVSLKESVLEFGNAESAAIPSLEAHGYPKQRLVKLLLLKNLNKLGWRESPYSCYNYSPYQSTCAFFS